MAESVWVTISSSELPVVLADTQASALLTGYNKLAVDRFAVAAAAVVAEIRAAVAKHGRFVSTEAATIPPEAKTRALWLVLEQIAPAISTLALSADQKAAIGAAKEWLKSLREDRSVAESVTMPGSPQGSAATVQQGGRATVVGTVASRRFTREQTDGLG